MDVQKTQTYWIVHFQMFILARNKIKTKFLINIIWMHNNKDTETDPSWHSWMDMQKCKCSTIVKKIGID